MDIGYQVVADFCLLFAERELVHLRDVVRVHRELVLLVSEVLGLQLGAFEDKGGVLEVPVVVLPRQEHDQVRHVFLELREIRGHVVLIEGRSAIVLLVRRDTLELVER